MKETPLIFCLGGASFNHKYTVREKAILGTSNPATGQHNFGGVARNVAENLARLEVPVGLWSVVGDDANGSAILHHMRSVGCDVNACITLSARSSAVYTAILDADHDLLIGIADMDIFEALTAAALEETWAHIASARIVFADCNLPAKTLDALLRRRKSAEFILAIDPVSIPKARRLPDDLSGIDMLFTNVDEAIAILGAPTPRKKDEIAAALIARGISHVALTDGAAGVTLASGGACFDISGLPAVPVDASGAGDGLIAGTLWHLLSGASIVDSVQQGLLLATLTLERAEDVRPDLSPHLLAAQASRLCQGKSKK